MENELEILKKKVGIYFKDKTLVHVGLKKKKDQEVPTWANGTIVEIQEEYFKLNEKKKGIFPIFYTEIFSIGPYELEDNKEDYSRNQSSFYQR